MTTGVTAHGNETRSSEQVMREVMAAFERQDVEGILSFYPDDDDFVYIDMAQPDQVLRGRDGMRAWLAEFWSVVDMTGAEMRLLTVTSEGERVAAEFELDVKYVGEGASPGGTPVLMPGCLVQRVVDGRIREERLYMDSQAIQRQLDG